MREPDGTSNSASQDAPWRVRLVKGQDGAGPPLGAGVLLPGGLVLTCAHVVLAKTASRTDRSPGAGAGRGDEPPRPVGALYAEFPGVRATPPVRLRAEVLADHLKPLTSHFSGDIALLRLASVPPVEPAVPHLQIPARDELVHSVGYTAALPGGEDVNARLRGWGGPGRDPEWVQLDRDVGSFAPRRGFSGSGVVHTRSGAVIGIMAYQFENVRDRISHTYMIPTDTIVGHLSVLRSLWAEQRDELKWTGRSALSRTIPRDPPASASNRALGLRRKVTNWLVDAAPVTGTTATATAQVSNPVSGTGSVTGGRVATEPVELIFVRDGRHDDISAIHTTLNLADRERNPRRAGAGDASEPPVGSIDLAVDAKGLTADELIAFTAERIGLVGPSRPTGPTGPGGPTGPDEREGANEHGRPEDHDRMLALIAGDSPPISAAFLSVDQASPTGEAVLPLLRALRASKLTRLLLVFRDLGSPLLDSVVDTLLDDAWAERRTTAIAARLTVLADLEKRFRRLHAHSVGQDGTDVPQPRHRQLAARLAELHQDGEVPRKSGALAHHMFLLDIDVEEAVRRVGSAVQGLDRPNSPGEYNVVPPGDDLTALPRITVKNPRAFVESEPEPQTPAEPDSGLTAGQVLHQQYEVVGLLGEGSHGKVYLACDQMLEDREVALKGVRDPADQTDRRISRGELLRLIGLNHPSIIKVYNYAPHPGRPEQPEHPANKAGFIVMEFANGAPLKWVAEQIERNAAPFDGYRVHEFIAAYGLAILDALRYLHEDEGFVYGDLSLTNVLHCGNGIKLIDVAGVRRIGHAGPVTFPAPEIGTSTKVTVAADLYAVGAVLQELLNRVPAPPVDLGTTSLQRVLHRAQARKPGDRFADAREMAVQLRGVLRELRSLRRDEETFEPSPLFSVAPAALDGELGKAPPLGQWRHGGSDKRPLTIGPPEPAEVAVGLPVPKVSKQDPNWKKTQRTSYDDPAGLLQLSAGWQPSPELALLRCRLHLEVGRYQPADAARHLASATAELERAEVAVGTLAEYDWRLRWHQGLLHLAGDDVESAHESFDQVYAAIPGEYAPKLALGYCHEVLGHPQEATVFYSAVWKRNRALGSAAFGLARIHLADGDTQLALDRLEAVPADSRHRTAARTAMVRIHADPPADGEPPTVAAAGRACETLHLLARDEGLTDRHAQDRLRTDLLELLLRLVTTPPVPDPLRALRDSLNREIAVPTTEHELRKQLGACYERLSEQVPRTPSREHTTLERALLDNAYRTRPYAFGHSRGEQRQGRLRGWRPGRLRGRATDPPTTDAATGER
ncbi:tetratricopeptide repeat protein [Streptomyces niveus]|uniref:tetratricopeptide repeat protein n=1 Tax=Streptomyces niveus TaxID=193462 RepID=UPI00344BC0D9